GDGGWEGPRGLAAAPRGKPVEPADETAVVRSERQRVSPEDPLDADERQDEEAVHDRREHVLPADEPAVEESERRGHEHHEGRGHEEPRGVAGRDRVWHSYLPRQRG